MSGAGRERLIAVRRLTEARDRIAAVAALHFAKFDARKRPHNVLCKEPTPNISADDSRGL